MSNSSYDGLGTHILTGAVIFSTFFLLVAVLASSGPGTTSTPQATTHQADETVVVTAPRAGDES
jgi:hypothetical protein